MSDEFGQLLELAAGGNEFTLCQASSQGSMPAGLAVVIGRGHRVERKIKVRDINDRADLDADVSIEVVRMPATGPAISLAIGTSIRWMTLEQSLHVSSMSCTIPVTAEPRLSWDEESASTDQPALDDLAELLKTEADASKLDPYYRWAQEFGAIWVQKYPGSELSATNMRIPAYHAKTVKTAKKRAPAVLGMLAPVLDVGLITAEDLRRLYDWLKNQPELRSAVAA